MAVVALRNSDPEIYDDPIFFHKTQIAIGTRLRCHGRRDPNSIWRVAEIATFKKNPSGKYTLSPTKKIVHLDDQLWLKRDGTNERRQLSFSALSYSAIWRLA